MSPVTSLQVAPSEGATPLADAMRVGPVAAIPQVMAELGVDAASIFSRVRVDLQDFADPETRLSNATLAALAHEASVIAGCPHFGLLVGDRARLGSFGSIGSLMRHSATVADALRTFVSKLHIYDWGGAPVLARHYGSTVILGYAVFRLSPTAIRYSYDAAAGILFRTLQDLCGPQFRPSEVAFAYPRPADIDYYRNYFGCKLVFNATLTGIVFEDSWLARPLAEAKPEALRDFVKRVAREEVEQEAPFSRRVELAIQQMLLGGTATEPAIAAMLNLSERSLRRRLDDEGEPFRLLLGRRRSEMAQRLLRNTSLPVSDVAFALQYKDANAFSRAFRAWADVSPSEWRAHARGF
jgi:AraC-like DNA-binding protein